jgi:hypothetical protein
MNGPWRHRRRGSPPLPPPPQDCCFIVTSRPPAGPGRGRKRGGQAIAAPAPATAQPAAGHSKREEDVGRRGCGGTRPLRDISFHPSTPGSLGMKTAPRPGRSARMKGGTRTASRASSRLGRANWPRRGCPAPWASESGRKGTARPPERLLPQDSHPGWHLPTPT